MKTDDLIHLLAEDTTAPTRMGRAMTIALLVGTILSISLLMSTIGMRPNMAEAMETSRVMFKTGVTLVLAVAACSLVFRIGRPGMPLARRRLLLAVPLVLVVVAMLIEMLATPADSWMPRMIGRHSRFCVFFIPMLSIAPLAGFLLVLRNGAPTSPGAAGAVAGLAASSIGAAIYAWHCPDDSPLFVASWYGLAIAIVVMIGYFLGRRLLRW